MTLRGYLFGLKTSVFFAFCAWASVVLFVDPETGGVLGKIFFFLTLFIWLSGTLSLVLVKIHKMARGDESAALGLGATIRRGTLIAGGVLVAMALKSWNTLALWNGALLAAAILLIELRFVHQSVLSSRVDLQSRGLHGTNASFGSERLRRAGGARR